MTTAIGPPPEVTARLAENLPLVSAGVQYVLGEFEAAVGQQSPDVSAAIGSCVSVITNKNAKGWRGALAINGYHMCGGENNKAISHVAGSLEVVHGGVLVWDDVQDDSDIRRGERSAHVLMRDHLVHTGAPGDPVKRGRDMAQTGAWGLIDLAKRTIHRVAGIDPAHKNTAGEILGDVLMYTSIGQLRDLAPVDYKKLNPDEILETYRLKTAVYTFGGPTKIGMAMAGAPAQELSRVDAYADPAGIAFQLQDDIVGTFGDEAVTGKPAKNDIIEGKPTWMVAKALEVATPAQAQQLVRSLGNAALSDADFAKCQEVLNDTGALAASKKRIAEYTLKAVEALGATPPSWGEKQVAFLRGLVEYNQIRQS